MATFSDNFNRANGGLGSDWTTNTVAPVIYSNVATGSSGGGVDTGASCQKVSTTDHYAQAVWLAGATHHYYQLGVRGSVYNALIAGVSATCYHVEAWVPGDNETTLYRASISGWVSLGMVDCTGYGAGTTYRLEIVGSTLRLLGNGTQIGSVTNTVVTTGTWTGWKVEIATANAAALDDWECGDIGGTAVSLPPERSIRKYVPLLVR